MLGEAFLTNWKIARKRLSGELGVHSLATRYKRRRIRKEAWGSEIVKLSSTVPVWRSPSIFAVIKISTVE